MPIYQPPIVGRGRAKNGTESLVLPGVELSGAPATLPPGLNTLYYFPIWTPVPIQVTGLLAEITTAAASAKARMGLYQCTSDLTPGALIVDGGEVDCSSTGVKEDTVSVLLPPGPSLIAWNCNSGSVNVRYARGGSPAMGVLPTLGANWYRSELTATSTYGALPASGVAWTATGGFSGLPPWFVFLRVAS
ncbi:MAG TPA: hypothetical protein PLO33_10800 [Kouleothrix sp.]|nr:hypothetical protein [Kouleothrix sp.]HRC76157.1 hypothetical protein [Kouleothrix sp.]